MRLKVERLGINGEGIAVIPDGEFKNKICFIDGALPEEIVDVKIVSNKKNFCTGQIIEVLEKSPYRVNPPCKYFGSCGGCDIQHLTKELQKKMKQDNVCSTIKKIAKIDVNVEDTVRLNDIGYRNKMAFPYVCENEENVLGMFAKNSHKIVDIDKCLLTSNSLNKFFQLSKEFLKTSKYKGYDFKSHSGDIKYLVARAKGDNSILVTFVVTRKLNLDAYYDMLKTHFEKVGLSLVISNSNDEIMSGKYYHIKGDEYLELEEFGIKYRLDNRGFLQVNNDIKHYLYNFILSNVEPNMTVIDAYSGAGLLSAIISKKCRNVTGIEINQSASNSANELSKINNLSNVTYICGDVKDNLSTQLMHSENCMIVLDPPRAGCDESVLNLLVSSALENIQNNAELSGKNKVCKVSKIIYVSCNVATLARDLGVLKEAYEVEKIIPLDMFPQTRHAEVVCVLKQKNNV